MDIQLYVNEFTQQKVLEWEWCNLWNQSTAIIFLITKHISNPCRPFTILEGMREDYQVKLEKKNKEEKNKQTPNPTHWYLNFVTPKTGYMKMARKFKAVDYIHWLMIGFRIILCPWMKVGIGKNVTVLTLLIPSKW